MRTSSLSLALACLLAACGSADYPNVGCGDFDSANCVEIPAEDSAALLAAVNDLEPDTTVLLGIGTYVLDQQVTIRAAGINLVGQGMDDTVLDFGSITSQSNGVDVQGDDFLVQDLTHEEGVGEALVELVSRAAAKGALAISPLVDFLGNALQILRHTLPFQEPE